MTTTELIAELRKVADRIRELRDDQWVSDIESELRLAERRVREAAVSIECR